MRDNNRQILINGDDLYKNLFRERGVKFIRQYETAQIYYPSAKEIEELNTIGYTWGHSERFYKLADKYYGDPTLWWILAWYNKKPTESHIKIGETIFIPLPLDKVLKILDR